MTGLNIGQRIRVSSTTLESGVPARSASLIWTHSEGVITEIRRVDINVIQIRARRAGGDHIQAYVRICARGPKLIEYGQEIKILRNAPVQERLFYSANEKVIGLRRPKAVAGPVDPPVRPLGGQRRRR